MSAPICPVHGEGFGSPCYLCVDAENRTLRTLYAEAVRALNKNEAGWCVCCGSHPDEAHASECDVHAVLSRPEAQEVLRG